MPTYLTIGLESACATRRPRPGSPPAATAMTPKIPSAPTQRRATVRAARRCLGDAVAWSGRGRGGELNMAAQDSAVTAREKNPSAAADVLGRGTCGYGATPTGQATGTAPGQTPQVDASPFPCGTAASEDE